MWEWTAEALRQWIALQRAPVWLREELGEVTDPPAWALGQRNITNATDVRTSIAAILPDGAGFAATINLLRLPLAPDRQPRQAAPGPVGPVQGELLLE